MSLDVCGELTEVLQTVQRPGDFCVSGCVDLAHPRLTVEGVGEISLPVLQIQADQLIGQAQRAPYGRGRATLLDTSVRRTWQISPQRLTFRGRHWDAVIGRVLARVSAGFGIEEPVVAELYKLLIYDQGSFFVSHRDTEKAPGMFATLVLALPSVSAGGELLVRHRGREVRLDLANDDPALLTFAAFYADCVHEVLPITAGVRVTLVYNLIRRGTEALVPPSYEAESDRLEELLRQWSGHKTSGAADDTPEKVVYLLAHAYTPAELGFARLKGADAAAAALLASVAPGVGCDLHLALLSIKESGSAEYNGSYRRYSDDADDYAVIEVIEHTQRLTEWRHPDGAPVTLPAIPLLDDEVSPPDAFDGMRPDEEHFHEATGNEGASFERTYQRAALVLWPRHRRLAVVNQAGPPRTLAYLESLTARWIDQGAGKSPALWHEAHELAGHLLGRWPAHDWNADVSSDDDLGYRVLASPASGGRREGMARLLAVLTVLEDDRRLEAALELLVARTMHTRDDNAAILAALARFSLQQAAHFIDRIVANHARDALAACASLLCAALKGRFEGGTRQLAAAARGLMANLPGDPSTAPLELWGARRVITVEPDALVDLVQAAETTDETLARQLARHVLAWPGTYGLDPVVIPALRQLRAGGASQEGAALSPLLVACVAHLQGRVDEPLEAHRDWSRAAEIPCTCRHCTELRAFLESPDQPTWTLWAAERHRMHVAHSIQAARADVDCTTVREGSPHGLACRKNSASHLRRVAQRHQDIADLEILKGPDALEKRPPGVTLQAGLDGPEGGDEVTSRAKARLRPRPTRGR